MPAEELLREALALPLRGRRVLSLDVFEELLDAAGELLTVFLHDIVSLLKLYVLCIRRLNRSYA